MKPLLKQLIRTSLAAALGMLVTATVAAQDEPDPSVGPDDSVGIVRISKPKTSEVAAPPQVTPAGFHHHGRSQIVSQDCECPPGDHHCQSPYRTDWRTTQWCDDSWSASIHRRSQAHSLALEHCWCRVSGCEPSLYYHDCSGQAMCDYFRCKFGYFIHTGAGGAGVPFHGKYARVYPQDPYYFDQRDGQAWGAQGYGIPMAVPLAPVVGHTYNYGWGTPSSRLTPVSRPAY